jgi:hypothetical protein
MKCGGSVVDDVSQTKKLATRVMKGAVLMTTAMLIMMIPFTMTMMIMIMMMMQKITTTLLWHGVEMLEEIPLWLNGADNTKFCKHGTINKMQK